VPGGTSENLNLRKGGVVSHCSHLFRTRQGKAGKPRFTSFSKSPLYSSRVSGFDMRRYFQSRFIVVTESRMALNNGSLFFKYANTTGNGAPIHPDLTLEASDINCRRLTDSDVFILLNRNMTITNV
jgi:hypothetical protein